MWGDVGGADGTGDGLTSVVLSRRYGADGPDVGGTESAVWSR